MMRAEKLPMSLVELHAIQTKEEELDERERFIIMEFLPKVQSIVGVLKEKTTAFPIGKEGLMIAVTPVYDKAHSFFPEDITENEDGSLSFKNKTGIYTIVGGKWADPEELTQDEILSLDAKESYNISILRKIEKLSGISKVVGCYNKPHMFEFSITDSHDITLFFAPEDIAENASGSLSFRNEAGTYIIQDGKWTRGGVSLITETVQAKFKKAID